MLLGITGVTGLIGKKLAALAQSRGHLVVGFSRQVGKALPHCQETRLFSLSEKVDLTGLHALIHLSGEPVIGLWTAEKRQKILTSRRETTRHLVASLADLSEKPSTFLCASGTGFYGNRGSEPLLETATAGSGFLAEVAQIWEQEAAAATALGIRVCQLRTGMVLAREGGAFPLLRRVFTLGLGGKIGDGQQFVPWIHLDDMAALYLHCLETSALSGPINAVAPEATTNLAFTAALAHAVHRPALFGVPAWAMRTLLRDLSTIILDSQRVVPHLATATSFRYAHPALASAFADLLRK